MAAGMPPTVCFSSRLHPSSFPTANWNRVTKKASCEAFFQHSVRSGREIGALFIVIRLHGLPLIFG